jgi:hypothetical protein
VGVHPYVVNLREITSPKPGRRAVVEQNESLTQAFLRRLQQEVSRRHLEHEVASYGESNPFPVVTLTCSPAVAQLIAGMSEVTDVYRDDDPSLGVVEPIRERRRR